MAPLGSFYQLILTDQDQDDAIRDLYRKKGWTIHARALSEQVVKTLLQSRDEDIVSFIHSTRRETNYPNIQQEDTQGTNKLDIAENMITDDFVVVKTELDLFDEPVNVKLKPESETESELGDEPEGIDRASIALTEDSNFGLKAELDLSVSGKAVGHQQNNSNKSAADLYHSNLNVDLSNKTPSEPTLQPNCPAKVQHLYDQYAQVTKTFYSAISQMSQDEQLSNNAASTTAVNTVHSLLKTLLTAKEAINRSFTIQLCPDDQEKTGYDNETMLFPQSTSQGIAHTAPPFVSNADKPTPAPVFISKAINPTPALPVMGLAGIPQPVASLPILTPPDVNMPILAPPNVSLPEFASPDVNIPVISPPVVSLPILQGYPLPTNPGTYITRQPVPRTFEQVKPVNLPPHLNNRLVNHPKTAYHPTKAKKPCNRAKAPKPMNANIKTDFQCEHCLHYYASSRGLRKHVLFIHPDKTPPQPLPVCHTCKAEYKTREELLAHRKETKHRSWFSRYYQCNLCGEYLSGPSVKENHEMIPHKEKDKFPCDVCGAILASPKSWTVHKREEHEPPDPVCDICGKTFENMKAVMSHRRRHNLANKKFKCEHCGKTFFNRGSLNFHERIHTGYKPYKCQFCDYTSSWQGNIRKHEKIHNKNQSEEQIEENVLEEEIESLLS